MTPQQRSDAARKASATRRANRAAGIGPAPRSKGTRRARGGPAFATPKPKAADLKLVVLAALENAFVVKMRDEGITPDARKAWDQYQKIKALGLGPVTSPAMQLEAATAMRMAIVNLSKLVF